MAVGGVGRTKTPPPHPLTHSLTASQLNMSQSSQFSSLHAVPSSASTYQQPGSLVGEGGGGGGRECDRIVRSLLSGFPNEVDFALNVITMMSFEKPAALPIAKVLYTCYYTCTPRMKYDTCMLSIPIILCMEFFCGLSKRALPIVVNLQLCVCVCIHVGTLAFVFYYNTCLYHLQYYMSTYAVYRCRTCSM